VGRNTFWSSLRFVAVLNEALRYNSIHDRSNLSVIRPGLFAVAPGSTFLPHHYIMKRPPKQLQEVFA
jgi:hypothetical protein